MSTKAERHAKRADAYAGYQPKSSEFYVLVTTPPSGVRMEGPYSTHEEAAERRAYVQGKLAKGNAFVRGEASLRRAGLL